MQLGIGSYAYRWAVGTRAFQPARPARIADMIESTASLGVTLLQIADNRELDAADDEQLTTMKSIATAHGIRLEVGLSGATEAGLRRYLHIARTLDAAVVRVVLHDAAGLGADPVQVFNAVVGDYSAAGIVMGIENHFLTPSHEMTALVERIDNPAVGVILDVGNSIVCGEWPERTIELLAPYAVGMHLKDFDVVPDAEGVGGHLVGRPLGEGRTDIAAALASVAASAMPFGGEFGVVLEQWSPRGSTDDETLSIEASWRARSVDVARDYLASVTNERMPDAT